MRLMVIKPIDWLSLNLLGEKVSRRTHYFNPQLFHSELKKIKEHVKQAQEDLQRKVNLISPFTHSDIAQYIENEGYAFNETAGFNRALDSLREELYLQTNVLSVEKFLNTVNQAVKVLELDRSMLHLENMLDSIQANNGATKVPCKFNYFNTFELSTSPLDILDYWELIYALKLPQGKKLMGVHLIAPNYYFVGNLIEDKTLITLYASGIKPTKIIYKLLPDIAEVLATHTNLSNAEGKFHDYLMYLLGVDRFIFARNREESCNIFETVMAKYIEENPVKLSGVFNGLSDLSKDPKKNRLLGENFYHNLIHCTDDETNDVLFLSGVANSQLYIINEEMSEESLHEFLVASTYNFLPQDWVRPKFLVAQFETHSGIN